MKFDSIPQSYYDLVEQDKGHKCHPDEKHFCVKVVSVTNLPSRFGSYLAISYHQTSDDYQNTIFEKLVWQ